MTYPVEPLPEEPEQKKDLDHPAPLVRLTEYGKAAVMLMALAGLVHDPHTENKVPSNRVNSYQVAKVTTYAFVSANIVTFGNWRTPGSNT